VSPKATAKTAKISRFRDWLLAEMAADMKRLNAISKSG
jgi:hypothetical protein